MTLLTTVRTACELLTIPIPTTVVGNTDVQVAQLRGLLMATGTDLLDKHDWSALLTAATFTCAATNAQTGYPPAAFERMSDNSEMWNDTTNWRIDGPTTAQDWTYLLTASVATLPQHWRMIDGVFNIYAPSDGDTIRYEYVSKYWILQAGVTPAATFSADTDTFEFPELLLSYGIIWRWKQAKGLAFSEDLNTFNEKLAASIKKDKGGLQTLTTVRPQDSDWPSRRRTWPPNSVTP